MSFLKKLFGKPETAAEPEIKKGLFGLKLGAAIEIQDLDFRILADELLLEFPGTTQLVEAEGEIDLGAGSRIKRYYTSDDTFLQLSYTGEARPDNVEDIKLFAYDESKQIIREADWLRWLKPETMGPQSFEYRGKTFQRAFSDDIDANVPPLALSERIENKSGDRYGLDNFCMLFQRQLSGDTYEYLLINGEESDDGQMITMSLGVDLSPMQFSVIS